MWAKLAHRLEDVEEMIQAGRGTAEILKRLDTSAAALTRYLYRKQRPDLARPFTHELYHSRKDLCSCGTKKHHASTLCLDCSQKRNRGRNGYYTSYEDGNS